MTQFSLQALTGAGLWFALVVLAQVLTPGQSPLSMGMSGLARGPHGWMMKLAFVLRGLVALALVAAVCVSVPAAGRSLGGMVLFALWGAGSALLAVWDTDMPGDKPTPHGVAHTFIGLAAYFCAVIGAVLISLALRQVPGTADVARWALPIALAAAVLLFVQFAGFGAAARSMERGLGRYSGLLQRVFLVTLMVWVAVVAIGI